ncbi:MAG: hypothetical protein RL508_135 [Actinomycetota bacterium]|jgi:uncharacterized protein (TIGR00251 family)
MVKPGSKKGPLVEVQPDGSLTVFIKERAVDGAANEGLIRVLADHFDLRKQDVTIESGYTSRIKRVQISDGKS